MDPVTREFKYANGDQIKEKVTGFVGIITGTCFYLTGCNQYLVVAQSKDEMSEAKSIWYNEGRLELLAKEVVRLKDVEAEESGCDIPAPNKG